jgi:hypothetical protein
LVAVKHTCVVRHLEPAIPLLDNLCIRNQSVKGHEYPRTCDACQVFAQSSHNTSHRVHVIKDCVDEAVEINAERISFKRSVVLLNGLVLA